jgi:hypothetical protein
MVQCLRHSLAIASDGLFNDAPCAPFRAQQAEYLSLVLSSHLIKRPGVKDHHEDKMAVRNS